MAKLSLEMIKGYDRNSTPFSAFVVCTAEDMENIEKAKAEGKKFDFSKLEVVYKIRGHDISQKVQSDVMEYVQHKNYIYAYKNILDQSTEIQSKGIVLPLLPANINPIGQELLAYLKVLKQHVNDNDLGLLETALVERALPDAEQFYTDVVGHAPNYED
jgi:hypothetical protein